MIDNDTIRCGTSALILTLRVRQYLTDNHIRLQLLQFEYNSSTVAYDTRDFFVPFSFVGNMFRI